MKTCFRLTGLLLTFILVILISASLKAQTIQIAFTLKTYNGGYNVSCYGASDGNIDITVVGGTWPYTYFWSNGAVTKNLHGVVAATYTVTVTDLNNNTAQGNVSLMQTKPFDVYLQPSEYSGSFNISETGANNGYISCGVIGGTPPYTYLWSNASVQESITELVAGTYTATVTDMNQCQQIKSVTLVEPTPLHIVSLTSPLHHGYHISCSGGNNGIIYLTVAGGTPPYTYEWSNGNFIEDLTDLPRGVYSVRITDANSAIVDDQIILTEPNDLAVHLTRYTYGNGYNTSCHTCANGSVTTTVTGGTTPYSYLWSGGHTSLNITNIGAGDYMLTVTDANGCQRSSETVLTRPDQPQSEDWTIAGNIGTNPGTNFIGSSDNKDVVFKSYSNERLRIKANGDIKISSFTGGSGMIYSDANGILYSGKDLPIGCMPIWYSVSPNVLYTCPTTKIGIGTYAPAQKLDVHHSDARGGINITTDIAGNNAHSEIRFMKGTTERYAIGNDFDENGSQNFFIWDHVNSSNRIYIDGGGHVGINMIPPVGSTSIYKLYVDGGVVCRDVKVTSGTWPDYVFEHEHQLMSIHDLDNYILQNKHLPGVKTADEIKKDDGFSLGEMQTVLLKKIEEQTLYIISLQKQVDELKTKIK